jgi:GNAT superfamily N-acetyltransferase
VTTDGALLAAHDSQVRATVEARLPRTWTTSRDGQVLRVGAPHRSFAFSDGLTGASVEELDGYIHRARQHFADQDEPMEWKLYSNDHPLLRRRLEAAGFRAGRESSVMVGRVADVLGGGQAPEGITIRATSTRADLGLIAALESEVWAQDLSWLPDNLADRIAGGPDDIVILLAEAGDVVVSAAWLVVMPGTGFGGLLGGSTLARWRRRGIYRALVAERARLARERGLEYLQVDASEDSRPVLERLGLHRVATTTPMVWQPGKAHPPGRTR